MNSSKELYQLLITPLEDELKKQKIQNILFSVDQGLRTIPMAALSDGNHFLVEKYSLGISPSISLTDTNYVDLKNFEVFAMGASKFPDPDINPLPAVPLEISNIRENWSGKSFLDQDFTFENLQTKRQSYKMIHLATHGNFNKKDKDISETYIQFYNQQIGLDKIRHLEWNNPQVELLVLSACDSGTGDQDDELGFAGLVVKTGVKSAVASLWHISDTGTLGLMTEFYKQLKTARIKAEALQQAQISMIRGEVKIEGNKLIGVNRNGAKTNIELPPEVLRNLQKNSGSKESPVSELKHPYYWAPFIMIGSPW